jgi:hypothetical protein
MPYFTTDAEIDIDVDEFLSACSKRELKELIKALKEDGYINSHTGEDIKPISVMEEKFINDANKLMYNYHRLTQTEIDIIESISKRL